jgi:hypothetical protein
MEKLFIPGLLRGTSVRIIVSGMLACSTWLGGQNISVRIPKGFSHGYLILRDARKTIIASGELTQTVQQHQIVSRLVYRFKDGSLDDDTTVFEQDGTFHLVRDHHVQKGPSFPTLTTSRLKPQRSRSSFKKEANLPRQSTWICPPIYPMVWSLLR